MLGFDVLGLSAGASLTPVDDRYQNQSWHIKLWRLRQYLWVPLHWVLVLANTRDEDLPPGIQQWGLAWRVAVGSAQVRMNYVFTWDEVKNWLEVPKP